MPARRILTGLLLGGCAVWLLGGVTPAARGGAEAVTVYVDQLGVPHIEAATDDGLAYGTGYALARQRLFLTLGIRAFAEGEESQLLGAQALPADEEMRRDYYNPAEVQSQYDTLPAPIKSQLQAFSDGFNKGMSEVMADPSQRPVAFDILGYSPPPWRPTDSAAVTMLFTEVEFGGLGGDGQLPNAALLGRLLARYSQRKALKIFNDVVFRNDPAAPSVIPRAASPRAPKALRRQLPRTIGRAQLDLVRALSGTFEKLAAARAHEQSVLNAVLKHIPVPHIGSYGDAIAGSRTRSGGGLLMGSPQSGISAPSIFWQLGQHAGSRDCTGFTVPGLGPWTGVGWCANHAWTLIAGNMGEQVDNYVETLDPNDRYRYRFRGRWLRMTRRFDTINVNKCLPPICSTASPPETVNYEIDSTVHGPVIAWDIAHHVAITQRRAQRGVWLRSLLALDAWNRPADVHQFDRATATYATATYNQLFADNQGHILYRFTGLQPLRARGIDQRLPSPGGGRFEWRRMLSSSEMPHVIDPRGGLLSVNQGIESKPAVWWPNASSIGVGQASRVAGNRRIVLAAGHALDVPSFAGVVPRLLERQDVITPVFAKLIRRALKHSRDPQLRQALSLFNAWAAAGYPRTDTNGDGSYDYPAITLFGADNFDLTPSPLWPDLITRVFSPTVPNFATNTAQGTFQAPGDYLRQLSTLKLALDGSRASLRLSRSYLPRGGAPAAIRASLRTAIAALTKQYGTSDMTRWLTPVPTQTFSALGVVAPPPIKGFDHGTYQQIVDPKADTGVYILPPGNGSADSAADIAAAETLGQYPKHFTDQRLRYEQYGYFPMPHDAAQYKASPETVYSLQYSGP